MAERTYNLREDVTRNYRQLSSLTIPRINRTRPQDKLYAVEVVEGNGSRAKIHHYQKFVWVYRSSTGSLKAVDIEPTVGSISMGSGY